jgi:hypothetical protein
MATKTLYATGDFRYGTRMLKASDPVEMNAPEARLYIALGKVTPDKPRAKPAAKAEEEETKPVRKPRKRAAKK